MNIFELIAKKQARNAAPETTPEKTTPEKTAHNTPLRCAFVVDESGEIETHELHHDASDYQIGLD